MKYILDTDALVDAWTKLYQLRFIPTLWEDKILKLAQSSNLAIPDAVILELEGKDDDLYKWCKLNEDALSIESDSRIQSIVKNLATRYRQFTWSGKPRSKNFADLFVIAHAKADGCFIITHEQPSGDMKGPKLPDICRAESIICYRFHDLIVQEGWIFR